ncbi:MAG: helix-hairpin-helix domain-containing protein [bacterium]|nr:helix-hairpin-helix domain-containing protein [bacterium]
MGEKTAEKIVAYRPYKKTEDLLKVPGLGKKKLGKLLPYITLGG